MRWNCTRRSSTEVSTNTTTIPGGERAQKAEDTFVKLGADRIADVVKRANNQYAANRDELQSVWDGTKEGFAHGYKEKFFDAFDDEYYALMKNDRQLYTMIGTYIKQHPQEFLTGMTE